MSELQFLKVLVENGDSYSKFFSAFIIKGSTILFIKPWSYNTKRD